MHKAVTLEKKRNDQEKDNLGQLHEDAQYMRSNSWRITQAQVNVQFVVKELCHK